MSIPDVIRPSHCASRRASSRASARAARRTAPLACAALLFAGLWAGPLPGPGGAARLLAQSAPPAASPQARQTTPGRAAPAAPSTPPARPMPGAPVRRRPVVPAPPAGAPAEVQAQAGAPRQVTASPEGFTIAQLKYGGGGDWYADETSISALLKALKERTSVRVAREERVVVSAGDEQLFNYPFLYVVGHGNIKFTPVEVERLRAYLQGGGFLWANDDYGMDPSFRRELRRIMPEDSLVELPFDHEIYRSFYKVEGGLPKIHEHDGGSPRGLGLYHGGRLVVFYDFDTDIGDGIEDNEMHHDPPEKREAAMKVAINIVMYALTH